MHWSGEVDSEPFSNEATHCFPQVQMRAYPERAHHQQCGNPDQWRAALTSTAIAALIETGSVCHPKTTCCRSASFNANSSHWKRPECSAFAARHISQLTQLHETQSLDAEWDSGSNPVSLNRSGLRQHQAKGAGTKRRAAVASIASDGD